MSLDTQKKGQIGINVVERIVIRDWKCRWQQVDSHNDDGIDGLIFLERNGEMNGKIIYAQIKSATNAIVTNNNELAIRMDKSKLKRYINRWRTIAGAAIIIYVDLNSLFAYWVDARYQDSLGARLLIPRNNTFNKYAKKEISRLCGTIGEDLRLKEIRSQQKDFYHLYSGGDLELESGKLYEKLKKNPVPTYDNSAFIYFDENGWRHIADEIKSNLMRYQSFVLLGLAKRLIRSVSIEDLSTHIEKENSRDNFVAARFVVTFTFRHTAIVKIVLKEKLPSKEYYFYNIFECRRQRNVLGVRNS